MYNIHITALPLLAEEENAVPDNMSIQAVFKMSSQNHYGFTDAMIRPYFTVIITH